MQAPGTPELLPMDGTSSKMEIVYEAEQVKLDTKDVIAGEQSTIMDVDPPIQESITQNELEASPVVSQECSIVSGEKTGLSMYSVSAQKLSEKINIPLATREKRAKAELQLAKDHLLRNKGFDLNVGDEVISASHESYYKAVIRKKQVFDGCFYFFMHYKGWNDKYDDWVEADRLYLETPEEESEQETARKGKGKKSDPEMSVLITEPLRQIIVKDLENITQKKKLLSLPCAFTISQIFHKFILLKKKEKSAKISEFQNLVTSLSIYFHKVLPLRLLYNFEKPQFDAVVSQMNSVTFSLADVYGLEHLLRLLVKIPSLLVSCDSAQTDIESYEESMKELVSFLELNRGKFSGKYVQASEGYLDEIDFKEHRSVLADFI